MLRIPLCQAVESKGRSRVLNRFAKLLLISTSLSPVLGGVAVNQASLSKPMSAWLPWLVAALLLVFVCWGLLRHAASAAQTHTLTIAQFEGNDKEVLAFLVAYLLPFVAAKDVLAEVHWLTGAYVFALILLVFTNARAYHFNPVMGLLGYHFYSIKNSEGASVLLISRLELRRTDAEVKTVRITHGIYLQTGG